MRRPLRSWTNLLGRLGLRLVEKPAVHSRTRHAQRQRTVESLERRDMLTAYYWDTNGATPGLGGSGSWDLAAAHWTTDPTGASATVAWSNLAGDEAIFRGTAGTITPGLGVKTSGITFETTGYSLNGSIALTLEGAGIISTATGVSATISTPLATSVQLQKTGAGTLTVSSNNPTLSSGTKIEAGTLRLAHTSAVGTGAIEIANSTLSLYRSGATTTYANAITSLTGTTGTLTVDGSGTNATPSGINSTYATGTITVNGTLTVSRPTGGTGQTSFTGQLAGSGNLRIANTNGGTTPSASAFGRGRFDNTSNTFSGSVNVLSGGNFLNLTPAVSYQSLDVAGGGLVTLLGNTTTTVGSLTGSGTITKSVVADTATLAVGAGNASSTFSGVIGQTALNALGTVALTKIGTGTLTLGGNNTFAGSSTIEDGTLRLTNVSAAGTGAINIGNGTLSLYRSGATTTYTNSITSQAGTSGTLTVDGSGTNAGTGTNSTYATGTITVDGTLTVSRPTGGTGNTFFTGLMTGNGVFKVANTNGGTAPSGSAFGRAVLGTTSNTFNGSVDVLSGGNFLNAKSSPSYATLDIAAGGYVTLTGTTTVGTLSGAGTITKGVVNNTATLEVGASNASSTFSGVIGQTALNALGTVALNKIGTGTLTLSGANTYMGSTAIEGGTVIVTNNNNNGNSKLGKGTLTVKSGATLQISGANALGTGNNKPDELVLEAGSHLIIPGNNYVQLPHVTINDATITSGSGHPTYGSLAFMDGISATGTAMSTITGQNMYIPGSTAIDVADGATLIADATFDNTSSYGESSLNVTGLGRFLRIADLVVNGSFERPDVTPGTYSHLSTIPGWTLLQGNVFEIQDNISNLGSASKGAQHLELDSDTSSSIVQQTIKVLPGGVYKVSFYYRGRPNRSTSDNKMNFKALETINGVSSVLLNENFTTTNTSTWTRAEFEFTATTDTIRLRFDDTGEPNSYGMFLDDVQCVLISAGDLDIVSPEIVEANEVDPGATLFVGQSGVLKVTTYSSSSVDYHLEYDNTKLQLFTNSALTTEYISGTVLSNPINTSLYYRTLVAGTSSVYLHSSANSGSGSDPLDEVVIHAIPLVIDIDVDSDNDGIIDPDNTATGTDDPIENDANKPGKRINSSSIEENASLAIVELRGIGVEGMSTAGLNLTLTASNHIKVWKDASRETLLCAEGQSITLPLADYLTSQTVYVEGLSAGEASLIYTLDGDTLSSSVSDTVKLTVNDHISLEVVDREADEQADTASFRIKRTSTGDAQTVRFRVLPQSTATSAYGSTIDTFDKELSSLFGLALAAYQTKDYDLEAYESTLQYVSASSDGIDFDVDIPMGVNSVLVSIKGVADTLTEVFRETVIVKLIERPDSESGSSESGSTYTIESALPEALDIKDSGSSIVRTTSHAAMLHDIDPVNNYFGIFVDGWVHALYDPVNKPWLNPTVAEEPAHGYAQVLPNGSFSYYPNVSKIGEELKLNTGVPYVGEDTFTVSVNVNDHLDIALARHGSEQGESEADGVNTLFVKYLLSLHPQFNPLLNPAISDLSQAITQLQSISSDTRNQVTQSVTIKITNDAPQATNDNYPVVQNQNDPPENGSSDPGSYIPHDRPVFISSDQGVLANDKDEYQVRKNGKGFAAPVEFRPEDPLKASLVNVTEEAQNGRGQKGPTAQGGTIELFENGSFIYTPKAGFTGEDTFEYMVSDGIASSSGGGSGGSGESGEGESGGSSGSGGSSSSTNRATVTLVVGNTAPEPIDREFSIVHDSGTLFISEEESILGADLAKNKRANDIDSDVLKVTNFVPPAQGTFDIKANGAFAYTPQAGFVGTVTIPVTVTDGIVEVDATITIKVTNEKPEVTGEGEDGYPYTPGYSTWHSTALHVTANNGVLANDYDPDLDHIWVLNYTQPQHGNLTLNKDGSFSYIPEDGKVEDVTFTYQVTDGLNESDFVTAKIEVRNEKPVGKEDYYEAETDGVLSVLRWDGVIKNDSDANGDYLEAELINGPSHGTLQFRASGGFVYTPNPGFEGQDSFTYKLLELSPGGNLVLGAGESSSDPATAITANIYVTDKSSQNAPDAQDDSYETSHTQPLVVSAGGGLLANDSDRDDDPLFATLLAGPTKGTVAINSDGSFLYTPIAISNPGPGLAGTDSFTYLVSDGHGNTSTATATVIVLNAAPIARDVHYEVNHGGAIARLTSDGILSRAFDGDGDILIASIPLTSEELRTQIHGELVLDASGAFFYRPDAGFAGTVSVPFLASDGLSTSAAATLTITVLNAAPKANDDNFKIVHNSAENRWYKSGQEVSLAPISTDRLNDQKLILQRADGLLKNDTDRDQDPLTVHLVTASLPDPSVVGTLAVDSDGSLAYTPKLGYQGTFTFTYYVNDGYVNSENATVTIEVTNQSPVAQADAYKVAHNTSLITSTKQGVMANDWDADTDVLQVQLVDDVTSGTLYLDAKGWFVYTTDASFVGTTSFTYRLTDGLLYSATTTVSLIVEADAEMDGLGSGVLSGRAPTGAADTYHVNHDAVLTIHAGSQGLLDNDGVDQDGILVALPVVNNGPSHGVLQLAADGSFRYTPTAGYVGSDTFSYLPHDGLQGGTPVTVTINVTNSAPTNDAKFSFDVHAGKELKVTWLQGAVAGAVDLENDTVTARLADPNTPLAHGVVTLSSDGSFIYLPEAGFVGDAEFAVELVDAHGAVSSAIPIKLKVTNKLPQIDERLLENVGTPQGNIRKLSTTHDQKLVVPGSAGLLASFLDEDGDHLRVVLDLDPENAPAGTLYVYDNGGFIYTPPANTALIDSFIYRVSDDRQLDENGDYILSDPIKVLIDVRNSLPSILPTQYRSVSHNGHLLVPANAGVLPGMTDADGDLLSVQLVSGPASGILYLDPSGAYFYDPNDAFYGQVSFTYLVSDGLSAAQGTVIIDVTNMVPTAKNLGGAEGLVVLHDTALPVYANEGLLNGLSDDEGDALAVSIVTNVAHGELTLKQDGSFYYQPSAGYSGPDSFTYKISDGLKESQATVTFKVEDHLPVGQPDEYTVYAGDTLYVGSNLPSDGITGGLRDSNGIWHGAFDANSLLANDEDADNTKDETRDPMKVRLVTGPEHAEQFELNEFGYFIYTPNIGFPNGNADGVDTFTYRLVVNQNGQEVEVGQPITVTINVLLPALEAADDGTAGPNSFVYEVEEGETLIVKERARGVLGNDAVGKYTTVKAELVGQLDGLTLNDDGTFEYVASQAGVKQFSYDAKAKLNLLGAGNAENTQRANVTIVVKSTTNPKPERSSYPDTAEGQRDFDVAKANYEFEKAYRAKRTAQYENDTNDWQTKYESPLQFKELTDNVARRNQQIQLAEELFDDQTTNLTALKDSTALRVFKDQFAVFNHWSSVGDQNAQLLQQTAVKSAALESNLAQADYQYFVSMNGEDAAQRATYVLAFGGMISSTAGTQITFLETERTLKQALGNNMQGADDSYQAALDAAEAAHVLRMQSAKSGYEIAVQQARDVMNDSLQDLFDQYNLDIAPLEAAKEAALQAAKTAYTQAVTQAENDYANGTDDRSSTGSLNLNNDSQYLADIVVAQQAYATALAAADQAYADIVGPARAILMAAVENAYHQFDATTAGLAQTLQSALVTAAYDYSEELKDALADFNSTNHDLQATYTSGVVAEQLNHANRLHSANQAFDTALRDYKSGLDQAITAANNQWKVTVRDANIQYDVDVYTAELSLRGDLHDNVTTFDQNITTNLTNRANQGHQADSGLQTEKRQQRATRDATMLEAWNIYQDMIDSEREQQVEAILGKPAQGQQAAIEGALQHLFANLAENGVEFSNAQIAAQNTQRLEEAEAVLILSNKNWKANVDLIEAEKDYAETNNQFVYDIAREAYKVVLVANHHEYFLTKVKDAQIKFTNALMDAAKEKGKKDAEARNDNQQDMQQISATFTQNVATASLVFDTAAIAASLVEAKSNIDSASANTIANSQYETDYLKAVATAEKALSAQNATRRQQYATTEAAEARTLAETLGTARHDAEIEIATALADFKSQQLSAGSIIAQAGQDSLVTLTSNLNTLSLDLQADSQQAALDFEDRLKLAIDDRAVTERAAQVDFNTGLKVAYQVAMQSVIAAQTDFANSEVAAAAAWTDAHEQAWEQFRNDVATAQVDGVDRWATTEGTFWAGLVADKVAAYRDWIADTGDAQAMYQLGVADLSQQLSLDHISGDAVRRLTIGNARIDRFESEDTSVALLEEDRETAFVSLRTEQRDLQSQFNDDLNDAIADQNADLLSANSDFQQSVLDAANIRTSADILQTAMLAASRAGEYQAFSFAIGLLGEIISQMNATSDKTLQTELAENDRLHANSMADAGHQFTQDAWGHWKDYAKGLADLGADFTTKAKEWINAYQTGRDALELTTVNEIRDAMIEHAEALIEAERTLSLSKIDQPLQELFKNAKDYFEGIQTDQVRPQRPATDFEKVKNFANGFLDGLSGGITRDLRHWVGGYWAYSVDEKSGYYQVGHTVGIVALTAASFGGGGAICGLNVVIRALTFGTSAYSAAKGAYNIATGKGTVWDGLALLPVASFGVGWLGKQAGVWGCFEANTLVDIPAWDDPELLAAATATTMDGRWLLIPGALALLYLRHRLRRRREEENDPLIDKRYAAWWLRVERESNENDGLLDFSKWRLGRTLAWA